MKALPSRRGESFLFHCKVQWDLVQPKGPRRWRQTWDPWEKAFLSICYGLGFRPGSCLLLAPRSDGYPFTHALYRSSISGAFPVSIFPLYGFKISHVQDLYSNDRRVWNRIFQVLAEDLAVCEAGLELGGDILYPIILGNKGDWSYLVSWWIRFHFSRLYNLSISYIKQVSSPIPTLYLHSLDTPGFERQSWEILPESSKGCWGGWFWSRGRWDMSPVWLRTRRWLGGHVTLFACGFFCTVLHLYMQCFSSRNHISI